MSNGEHGAWGCFFLCMILDGLCALENRVDVGIDRRIHRFEADPFAAGFTSRDLSGTLAMSTSQSCLGLCHATLQWLY